MIRRKWNSKQKTFKIHDGKIVHTFVSSSQEAYLWPVMEKVRRYVEDRDFYIDNISTAPFVYYENPIDIYLIFVDTLREYVYGILKSKKLLNCLTETLRMENLEAVEILEEINTLKRIRGTHP